MNLFWDYLTAGQNWTGPDGIVARLGEHLGFLLTALVLGALVAIPLGALIGHTRRATDVVLALGGAGRYLPSIAVLMYLVRRSGVGNGVVLLALVLIAIPPLVTATHAGVRSVDRRVVDAARGLGMQPHQVLLQVEAPAALTSVIDGARRAAVQVTAAVTIAAYVKAGGLGRLFIDGLAEKSYGQMATGAVVLGVLALVIDLMLSALRRTVVSPGLTGRYPARAAVVTKGDYGVAAPPLPEGPELPAEAGSA
jgi:osmoprotectant transport system permease protein